MPKISDLTAATSVNDADSVALVQSGSTKEATFDLFRSAIRDQDRWQLIDTSKYTATPGSTSTISMSDTSDMAVGLPLKYTYSASTHYGIITAVSTDTSITLAGFKLDTGADLTALYVGHPEMVVQMPFFINGQYGNGGADLLSNDMNAYCRWTMADARLVRFEAAHDTADTGASQPKINVKIAGSLVGTEDTSNGIQLSTSGTWVKSSAVAIDGTNYTVSQDDSLEVTCTVAGTNGDASDLSGNIVFVME